MATLKVDPNTQYVVKSATPELACNEFMYHKIATALGLHTQEVKLFQGVSKYAADILFSQNARKFDYDNADITNRKIFYKFLTLYVILNEEDSQEFYMDEQGSVFKLDNAAAFNVDPVFFNVCFLQKGASGKIFRERKLTSTEYSKYNIILEILTDRYGQNGKDACLEMFRDFTMFDETTLEEAYKTLNKLYPKKLSSYYREFIQIRKEECLRFLSDKGDS